MERFKVVTLTVTMDDLHLLQESLWHTVQREDLSSEDHARACELRKQLKEFDVS